MNLLDTLMPQTPPAITGARVVAGRCQSGFVESSEADPSSAAVSEALRVAPRGTSEYTRAYNRAKKREARQRERDRMPLDEKYAPPSFIPLARTRGVYRKR